MMRKIYPDAREDIPVNAPEALGKPVQINVYCDANHAGNKVTRRSHSGIYSILILPQYPSIQKGRILLSLQPLVPNMLR